MPLPIDPLLPEIIARLRESNSVIVEAAPGAGKTTRVPPALMEIAAGEVLVLEPRRLAARLAARFVASLRGERIGETVGYQVRFEDVSSARTRLRFLTEGVLTRRLLSDPLLKGVGIVVLDEFHERHLEGDLALALLRRLQRTRRPDLKLVIMSATLDTGPVAGYLGANVVHSEGRQYPLEIEYTPHSAAPLEQLVAAALERVPATGHVLVFLPGAAEIRRAHTACAPLAARHGWTVLPLHGDLPPEEQDRAVGPSDRRKIILSTNLAESSVTIDGVSAVIDSGLARIAGHSPWSGLPTLQVARVSQASGNQRAGRAGRTGPGRAIRLYPLEDFVRRPAHDAPEILRSDLSPAALQLRAMGLGSLRDLEWLDAPPPAAVQHAEELLTQLGAAGEVAEEMARYPLHPRLARLIVEARRRSVAEDGCAAAAILSAGARLPARPSHATRSDVLALIDAEWEPHVAQAVRQIRRMVPQPKQNRRDEEALLISVLAAFGDRVAKRRAGEDLVLASGGPARLSSSSTVTESLFLVAVEAEDRRENAPMVRLASAIEPSWLLDLFPDLVSSRERVEWNRAARRVEGVASLMFGQIAIDRSETAPDPDAAAAMLTEKALETLVLPEEIGEFAERVRLASQHAHFPELSVSAAVRSLAEGLTRMSDLESAMRDGGLLRALDRQLSASERRLLEEIAPERLRLSGGRHVRVHYEAGQPPWIASRLQDFFGMQDTPRIGRGAVPVVVRLLAPNQRPVQTTTDLSGFWQRLYPQVRKELARRYPRHAWPENPSGSSTY